MTPRKMSPVPPVKTAVLQGNREISGDGGNRTHAIGPPSNARSRRERTPFDELPLDDQMHSLIVQLSMVSNGKTASYNSTGGGDTDNTDPLPPTGDDHPPHLYYARAYGPPFHTCEPICRHRVAQTDEQRAGLIADAQRDLQALRRGQPVKTAVLDDPDEYRAEMLHATEGWAPADVERSRWRMSARLVRRNRIADSRDPETGKKADPDQADAAPAEQARVLRDRGLSLRQIAMLVNKDQKQIQRYLDPAKRRAA